MTFIYIEPVQSGLKNQTLYAVAISVTNVVLDTNATIRTQIYNNNKAICFTEEILLTGQAYTDWGNNDEYIINYVLNYYGFTKLPGPPPE